MTTVFATSIFRGSVIKLYYLDNKDCYIWTTEDRKFAMDIGTGKLTYEFLAEALILPKNAGLKIKLNKQNFSPDQLTYYQRMV